MKSYRHIVLSLSAILVLMVSCNSSPIMTRATGLAYEVVATMDASLMDSELGKAIKGELQSPVPGLYQPEPSLRVTLASSKDFNGLLTYVRNIFILRVDPTSFTKASVSYEYDRWSSGQVVLTMNAPDTETALAYLAENKGTIVDFFVKVEMERAAEQMESDYSLLVLDKLKAKFDISLKVPSTLTHYRDTTGFFWASNDANTGRTDIVVYDFPYTDPNTFTVEYLVAKRDSVMKLNMPGAFPNSYMATEVRNFPVTYTPTNMNGKYCGVLRGLWRMQGDMMGGPFVSFVRLNEEANRIIVVEGFVFAPETDKRNFIRRIEASLHTLRLPGDTPQ